MKKLTWILALTLCLALLLTACGIFLLIHHNGIQTDYRVTL